MAESTPRALSFSILVGWPRIQAKVTPERSASAVWMAGRGYEQKLSQKAQFEHFGGLAVDIGKSVLRKLFVSIGFVHRCGVLEPRNLGASDLKVQICVQVRCS